MRPSFLPWYLREENDLEREIKRKQDEFLDLYSFFLKTGNALVKEELFRKAYELHLLEEKQAPKRTA